MHVYVAGIGGAGLGPLAEIAHQLGYRVSGSDLKDSAYINKLRRLEPTLAVNIGQTPEAIAVTHAEQPIDWYVYSSALAWANPPNPELAWIKQQGIRHSKRDEFLNHLIERYDLKLLAVAGSHGKTTTTAMAIWLFSQLGEKISYLIGGQLLGMPPARIEPGSQWFVYEADEFDRNFLAFHPELSLITGIDHEHPEVYPTKQDYNAAFWQFIEQSKQAVISRHDCAKLNAPTGLSDKIMAVNIRPPHPGLTLAGDVNRQNASLLLAGFRIIRPELPDGDLASILNRFPGCWRRFERIADNVYTDYAHNPIKIAGCLERASELGRPIVAVYEPHSNQRQHLVQNDYKHLFKGVRKLYWLPTFLSREDPGLAILQPQTFIDGLAQPDVAEPGAMDAVLKRKLLGHIAAGDIVVGMSAGDLDAWLRQHFGQKQHLKF